MTWGETGTSLKSSTSSCGVTAREGQEGIERNPADRSCSPSRCGREVTEQRKRTELTRLVSSERALAATWAPISKAECGKAFDGNNSKKILLGVQLARNEMEAAAQARLAKNMRELRMFVEEFEMV
uniref:Uncharacterized protein n=1 Tax=Guillardia theta TaxID=55529 RepID=A0A7S4P5A1_GUITH|mmetsp:Transcript_43343/g.137035  ORF Transcript_43343/g.137035 Transcript_43343/m.137035 type:complete len:126 (+) Transcript_43343:347-724(+)